MNLPIEVQIGVYSDNENLMITPKSTRFESLQELKSYLEITRERYDLDPILHVRLNDKSQSYLIGNNSNYAANEFLKEVYYHYENQNIMENKEENQIIGGKIKDIAEKSLTDKNYLYLFDQGTRNAIEIYLKVTPKTEPLKLEQEDFIALAKRWENEMNHPTEMSKGMTRNDIMEQVANNYSNADYLIIQKIQNQNKELNLSERSTEIPEINTLVKLSYDEDYRVRIGVAENPKIKEHKNINPNTDTMDIETKYSTAKDPNTPVEVLKKLAKDWNNEVREQVASNKNTPAETLSELIKDKVFNIKETQKENPHMPIEAIKDILGDLEEEYDNRGVRKIVAENPNTPIETLKELAKDLDFDVRRNVAENTNTPIETLIELSKDEEGFVRATVAENPNTPINTLLKLSKDDDYDVRERVAENPKIKEQGFSNIIDEYDFNTQDESFSQRYEEEIEATSVGFQIEDAIDNEWEFPMYSAAQNLPKGWKWEMHGDSSGSLLSPSLKNYFEFDFPTNEYRDSYDKEWTKIPYKNFEIFKNFAEEIILKQGLDNHPIRPLNPPLSEKEKHDLKVFINGQEETFKLSDVITEIKNSFNLEEKAYLREKLLREFNQNEFNFFDFKEKSNISMESIEKVDNFYNQFNKEHYTPVSEEDLELYGEDYGNIYVDRNFLTKVDEFLKAIHNDDNLRTEINEVYWSIKNQQNNINKNTKTMENTKDFNQVEYLKNQMKYLGFGESEKLHKDLENGINSSEKQFEIKTTSDKTLPGNNVDFTLKFNKSEKGGIFLNSYNATLTNDKGERSHNFSAKNNPFTAKEAVNLLEGRTVKTELSTKDGVEFPAFVKLNFSEKNQYDNYKMQVFNENYGVDTAKIVDNSKLIFDKPEYRDNTIKSLEKGNVVKVKFEHEGNTIEGKAVLNPQYKNISLYDNDMNRVNTNKPIQGMEQDAHEKNQVRQQGKSRGI